MLSIKRLRTFHGRKIEALKGVDIEVSVGELVALIGANGAGKSTLLKSIAGLLQPDQGEIVFQGQSLVNKASHQITELGIMYVPEGRHVFPRLTVKENLELGAYLRRDREGIAEDLERMFQKFPILRERLAQAAGTLSGGEQQMLAISRAMMGRPKLLMLDEPSMGLSPIMVDKIFQVVTEIHKTGMTILMVEQNAHRALEIAQRAYVLETGRIAMAGSGTQLLSDPKVQKLYLGME